MQRINKPLRIYGGSPPRPHSWDCACATGGRPKVLTAGRRGRLPRRRTGGCPERFRLPAAAVAMAAPAPGLISVFSSPQELGASLAQLVAQRAACCLAGARARFALGLSGGSLVSMLARELPAAAAPAGPAGLARWTVGFCDERLVPFEHAESTYGLYRVRATGAAGGHAERAAPTVRARLRGPLGVISRRPRPPPEPRRGGRLGSHDALCRHLGMVGWEP